MAHANQIRILSVEDHPVLRQGLATVIETEPDMILVGKAANGVEAIAESRRHRPDITLMDLRLPGANGTNILIAILAITVFLDEIYRAQETWARCAYPTLS